MSCCSDFDQAFNDNIIAYADPHEIIDGPLMNRVVSEYHLLRKRNGGYYYYGINFCPFCGKPRSLAAQGFTG